MSVPATLLLLQVTRNSGGFGGGLPPEDKRTEKQKRRDRIIVSVLLIIGFLSGVGVVWYIMHSLQASAHQLATLYAQNKE